MDGTTLIVFTIVRSLADVYKDNGTCTILKKVKDIFFTLRRTVVGIVFIMMLRNSDGDIWK